MNVLKVTEDFGQSDSNSLSRTRESDTAAQRTRDEMEIVGKERSMPISRLVGRADESDQSRLQGLRRIGAMIAAMVMMAAFSSRGVPQDGRVFPGGSHLPVRMTAAINEPVRVLLTHRAGADESLVYAVSTSEKTKSQILPKTDIFIVDPATAKQRMVFSDAKTEFVLLPGSEIQPYILTAGGRIFSPGMDRKLYAGGWQGHSVTVYEIPLDGSAKARKIFDIEPDAKMNGNFLNLMVSPTGSKIGYMKYSSGKPYLFLHETVTGKLLRQLDLSNSILDYSVTTIGWMPDGERLFFTLDRTDEDDNWQLLDSKVGSYVMNDDGSGLQRIAPEAAMHPARPGLRANAVGAAVILGALPGGGYLVRDSEMGPATAHAGAYLYTLDPTTNTQKTIRVDAQGDKVHSFRLSSSGRTLALMTVQNKSDQPETTTDSETVWVLDLNSGQQRSLFSFDFKRPGVLGINLIGWLGHR